MIFKCPKGCEVTHETNKFATMFKGGETIYRDNNTNKVIKCECGSNMQADTSGEEYKGYPELGRFSMLSRDQRKAHMKKRSSDHAKKHTREYRRHIDTKDLK